MLYLIAMQWIFGRLFASRHVSKSVAALLCVIVLQSPLFLRIQTFVETGLSLPPICASTAMGGAAGDPLHKRNCRTLECCALGCAAHDAACLEAAFARAFPYPWSMRSSSRWPRESTARLLLASVAFGARGPPARL